MFARYLCAAALAQFIGQPFASVFVSTNHLRLGLVVQMSSTFLPVLGLLVGGKIWGIIGALMLFSACSLVSGGILVWLSYRCCRHVNSTEQARLG